MTPSAKVNALGVLIVIVFLFSGCSKNANTLNSNNAEAKPEVHNAVRISPDGADAAEPAIAANGAGNLFVVYVEHLSKKGADVFIQKHNGSAQAGEARVRINPVAGSAKAWKGDPPTISIGTDNTIYVGWTRKLDDERAKGNDLMLSSSIDGGRTFAAPVKVNDDTKPASHGMHSLAVDKDGRVYIAWLDERNIDTKAHAMRMSLNAMDHEEVEPNSEVYYAISKDGGKTFSANKKIAVEVCPCCKTSLLAAADGTIYVGWRQVLKGDHRHIAIAHSNNYGESFSGGVVVSDDNWQINACPVSGAALSSAADQTLDVLWYTAGAAGQAGIYFARSIDGGKTFGARALVSSEAVSDTPVLLNGPDERTVAVFTGLHNEIVTASWLGLPPNKMEQTDVAGAALPAAAVLNGKVIAAFVRNTAENNSVWLSLQK